MADGYSSTQILGNIGSDPELKFTQGGSSYLAFSVAVGKSWRDKSSGERKEQTQWFRCKLWGDRAEGLAKHLHKGDRIHVVGEMTSSKYQKDGRELESWELRVERVTFCERKRDGESSGPGGGQRAEDPEPAGLPDNDPLPF